MRAAVLPQDEARGGLGVVDGKGGHGKSLEGHGDAGRHGGIGEHGRVLGDDGEVGPDGVVEQMRGDGVEDFGQSVDGQGRARFPGEAFDQVVGEEEDVLDVVQMGMGNENMFDAGLRGQIDGGGDGSGVEEHGIVDKKGRQVVSGQIRAGAAEHAQVHGTLQVAGTAGAGSLSRGRGFVKGGLDRAWGLV
ncbi:hypothetical protein DSECCO2_644700 [anaerobic digester metagenome]